MTHAVRARLRARIPFWAGAVLALLLVMAPAGHAAPHKLSDGSTIDSSTLPNGMRVITRDLPGAGGVSITLALDFGAAQDPAGRRGWDQLLANAWFLSAAGEFPERTLAAVASSRPLGYRIEVGPSYTRLTEVAAPRQFPGVLHETALRLRAAAPSAKAVTEARRAVQRQLAMDYQEQVPLLLDFGVRFVDQLDAANTIAEYASGRGIASASTEDVQKAIRALYVPANAVLSLAGDLKGSGIDVPRVIANEFGSIPAGSAAKLPPTPAPRAGFLGLVRDDTTLREPAGVIGVLAPALADTAHPSFYMNALVIGSLLAGHFGRSTEIPTPFRYSMLDEPDLVRFFTPVTHGDLDSSRVRQEYEETLMGSTRASISVEDFSALHDNVRWILGGPLTKSLSERLAKDSGLLAALSSTAAMRVLWGGDALWNGYLARFDGIAHPDFSRWASWFLGRGHRAEMMVAPAYLVQKTATR